MEQKTKVDYSFTLDELEPRLMALRFSYIDRDPKINAEQARQMEVQMMALYARNPGVMIDYLVDATQVRDVSFISVEARRMYKRAYNYPQVGFVAFVGLGRWLKLMTMIFTQVLGRQKRASWFDTEAEALVWLKQKRAERSGE